MDEMFEGIRGKVTRERYAGRLKQFFDWLKLEGTLEQQARLFRMQADNDPKWATYQINEWIHFQKQRAERGEISSETIKGYYKPIKKFCDMNDIVLNWKKIAVRLPQQKGAANDRIPEVSEIKLLLGYPDRRIKPIVLCMLSGGFRPGSWDYLHWGDIEPQKQRGKVLAAKVTIYRGEREEYYTFITPEAYNAVKDWMDFRAQHGEQITPKSWVMRDIWNITKDSAGLPRQLKSGGVKHLIERALWAQGIRKQKVKAMDKPGTHRHEFQAETGFRKFFKTVCERKMKTLNVEYLMGHDVGLNKNYNRPPVQDLLEDYLRAVPDLTILEQVPVVSEDVEQLKKDKEDLAKRLVRLEERDQENEFYGSEIFSVLSAKEVKEITDRLHKKWSKETGISEDAKLELTREEMRDFASAMREDEHGIRRKSESKKASD